MFQKKFDLLCILFLLWWFWITKCMGHFVTSRKRTYQDHQGTNSFGAQNSSWPPRRERWCDSRESLGSVRPLRILFGFRLNSKKFKHEGSKTDTENQQEAPFFGRSSRKVAPNNLRLWASELALKEHLIISMPTHRGTSTPSEIAWLCRICLENPSIFSMASSQSLHETHSSSDSQIKHVLDATSFVDLLFLVESDFPSGSQDFLFGSSVGLVPTDSKKMPTTRSNRSEFGKRRSWVQTVCFHPGRGSNCSYWASPADSAEQNPWVMVHQKTRKQALAKSTISISLFL